MAPSTLRSLTLSLRGFQFVLSAVALATIAGAFVSESAKGYSIKIGSHAIIFGMLMTFATMLYSLYDLVVVEYLQTVLHVAPCVQLTLNLLCAFLLFTAGLVLATSDYVKDCEMYEPALRCGSLTVGTVFTFIAMAAFIGSAALPFLNLKALTPEEKVDAAPYIPANTDCV